VAVAVMVAAVFPRSSAVQQNAENRRGRRGSEGDVMVFPDGFETLAAQHVGDDLGWAFVSDVNCSPGWAGWGSLVFVEVGVAAGFGAGAGAHVGDAERQRPSRKWAASRVERTRPAWGSRRRKAQRSWAYSRSPRALAGSIWKPPAAGRMRGSATVSRRASSA